MAKGLDRQASALRQAGAAIGFQRDNRLRVIQRIAQHRDAGEVLGGAAQQGHPADIDLLNSRFQADIGLLDRLAEGVQVADDHGDRRETVLGQLAHVVFAVAGQDAAVNGGVQGLDAPAKHLSLLR